VRLRLFSKPLTDIDASSHDARCARRKYCDGNSFSGALDDPLPVPGGAVSPIFFRGREILLETLRALKRDFGFANATEVHLTGCSAGGLATYRHVDMVGEWVEKNLPRMVKYGATPVSGFFLEHDTVMGKPLFVPQVRRLFAMSNASRGVNEDCLAAYSSGGGGDGDGTKNEHGSGAWKCSFAHAALAHTTRPVFAIDASFDSWQAFNVFISPAYDGANTGGFEGCVSTRASGAAGLRNCTAQQMFAVRAWQGDMVTQLMGWSGAFRSGHRNGAFVYQCFTHCAGVSDMYYPRFAVGGLTMSQAVHRWWTRTLAPTQQQGGQEGKNTKGKGSDSGGAGGGKKGFEASSAAVGSRGLLGLQSSSRSSAQKLSSMSSLKNSFHSSRSRSSSGSRDGGAGGGAAVMVPRRADFGLFRSGGALEDSLLPSKERFRLDGLLRPDGFYSNPTCAATRFVVPSGAGVDRGGRTRVAPTMPSPQLHPQGSERSSSRTRLDHVMRNSARSINRQQHSKRRAEAEAAARIITEHARREGESPSHDGPAEKGEGQGKGKKREKTRARARSDSLPLPRI
jgi:hypothetical protein